mgnify:CR=1 FL=1
MKIGILIGGDSSEREVSIASGRSIENACIALGHEVVRLDPKDGLEKIKSLLLKVDLVFNGLHGGDGENGKISKYLEDLGVLFTGSDSISSEICMNKDKAKRIAANNNVLTPEWVLVTNDALSGNIGQLNFPIVVKPNDQGSTLGLSIINSKSQLKGAFKVANSFASSVMYEQHIQGREITCSIVGNIAYPIVEIIPKHEIYDYECKYTKGMSKYICPAEINKNISSKIKEISLKIHKLLGCRHYSRVDFLLDRNNDPWFLEINTLPGMTETSLLPKSLESAGVNFNQIIEKIIGEAMDNS